MTDNAYDFAISLGSRCFVAETLNKKGLRYGSFPLDWAICYMDSLPSVIRDGFKSFIDMSKMVPNKLEIFSKTGNPMLINRSYPGYGVGIAHRDLYREANIDYFKRCIARWVAVEKLWLEKPTKILFVHAFEADTWDSGDYATLISALDERFPKKGDSSYKLLIVRTERVNTCELEGVNFIDSASGDSRLQKIELRYNMGDAPDSSWYNILTSANTLWDRVYRGYTVPFVKLSIPESIAGGDPGEHDTCIYRQPPVDFNYEVYSILNPDLAEVGINDHKQLVFHWLSSGEDEGRLYKFASPEDFDWKVYCALNPDLTEINSEIQAKLHWTKCGSCESRKYN
jgi:hypothetical protein